MSHPTGRFPGFDAASQAPHWDQVTADLITARSEPPPEVKFFNDAERACASALLDLLTGQDGDQDQFAVPVLEMIDARLAAGETDGWRYEDMPEDGQAWRDTLSYLDADAAARGGTTFAQAAPAPAQRPRASSHQAHSPHPPHATCPSSWSNMITKSSQCLQTVKTSGSWKTA